MQSIFMTRAQAMTVALQSVREQSLEARQEQHVKALRAQRQARRTVRRARKAAVAARPSALARVLRVAH